MSIIDMAGIELNPLTHEVKYMGRYFYEPNFTITGYNLEIRTLHDPVYIDEELVIRRKRVRMFIDGTEIKPETLLVADDGIHFKRPGGEYSL